MLMEKNREGQRELHYVFVDLQKSDDRELRGALVLMRKSGAAEKDVRVEQDMDESWKTMVRCEVGVTEKFQMEVRLHQGSALRPLMLLW